MGAVVDGVAAANVLLSWNPLSKAGYCLYYVWQAYATQGAWSNESYPTAYSAWLGSSGQHPGDRNPPAGVPVYWGPKASSNAGDVVISLGNGMVAATDWPYNYSVGTCTIDQREAQIGRPYLGWCDNILGNPILQVQSGPEPEPPRRKDNDMIYAAYRDDNGSIAIQHQPRGRIMLLPDPNEWAAINAATGAGYHQVSNQYLQDKLAWYGQLPYSAADMEHASGWVLVHESGGENGLYILAGGKLTRTVADNTLEQLQGRVPEYTLDTAEVQNLLESLGSDDDGPGKGHGK